MSSNNKHMQLSYSFTYYILRLSNWVLFSTTRIQIYAVSLPKQQSFSLFISFSALLLGRGQPCTMDCQCQSSLNLICTSGVCECPPTVNWFWSIVTSRCVLCVNGWTIASGRCYKAFASSLTWNTALSVCQSYGATLMVVRSQAEFDLTVSLYTTIGLPQIWVHFRFNFLNRIISRTLYFR